MNAVNHAATALLLKKRWPDLPLVPALVAVQLTEFLWVFLNLAGIEHTTTEPQVRSLADIHLWDMPYSHSLGAAALLAVAAWLVVAKVAGRPSWALPLAVGVFSHIVLDVATHAHDVEVLPFVFPVKIGSGLYDVPPFALVFETIYGLFCWWVFNGSRALLGIIVGFNLAALSFYVPSVPGPEGLLAGHPKVFALVILVHIVAAQVAVGYFAARRPARSKDA